MEQPDLRVFLEKAASQLAGIRGGLLLAAQNGFSTRDIEIAAGRIDTIEAEAASAGLANLAGYAEQLRALGNAGASNANSSLDVIAAVEADLLRFSLRSQDFLPDVDGLVDASFDNLTVSTPDTPPAEPVDFGSDFEIDEETLEVFQEEAEGLLENIRSSLQALRSSPDDTGALWEIRRSAHTFKGAAGIVGFKDASSLAHRMEDLLDKMVELKRPADERVTGLLGNAAHRLTKMTSAAVDDDPTAATALSRDLESVLASISGVRKATARPLPKAKGGVKVFEQLHAPSAPIVRVSLDRLDELIGLARRLIGRVGQDCSPLASEISQKLMQLRMVRFGTLEIRLARTVHVTCQEEGKRANIVIDGGDVEIDTQIMDALIEPLLHLLKNAVVHGIEKPETRRLLGKPEKGHISVSVEATSVEINITVRDDGSGISAEKLIRKAIANNLLSGESAETLSDDDVVELIFHRGLTTADSLNMNAGRGVGMSIIRESVESRGGTLKVATDPQRGSAFTITLPAGSPAEDHVENAPQIRADGTAPILVVDDSSSIRRQTAKFVEDSGLTAITAADGAEALELLLNGLEPALILSDVEMPNMNGWEFLEYVKTDDNFGHVPVVMITSLDGDQYRQMASKLGASDYIVKPFSAKDLENVLERFCSVSA